MKTVQTKKGTQLPLVNLKGKDYLMVAYRLQWLTEDVERYTIDTVTLHRMDDTATVQATIVIFDDKGMPVRRAVARKTESRKDFADFEEKAETGSIGRALAMLGFGTQHALSDLDEGSRIVDSPLVNTKTASVTKTQEVSTATVTANEATVAPAKKASFRKTAKANGEVKTEVAPTVSEDDGWTS